ncbi:hypothetical protein HPB52_011416 [Rhipicephalus sanguineus]|uniref:Nlr family card domain protein n=1 Tax=Rhipicephalus sanguineus TaxID=34632 RepID=A0A9D4PJ62_RHISA|nr:hypothetical protein HPB52_011416 [Rhipicephalus sanguineus]
MVLPPDVASELYGVLSSPSDTTPYQHLKTKVLQRFIPSPRAHLQQLLAEGDLATGTPLNCCAECDNFSRGDTSGIVGHGGVDDYRPPCTAYKDQVCQINNFLPNCNELLFDNGLELREQRGGSLSLMSIEISDANLTPTPGPDSYRATPFLRWLLKTHVCISSLELIDDCIRSHSEIIMSELPDHSLLKKLTLTCYEDDAVHTHTATVLPRLRSLEVLNCFFMCRSSDALVGAVSVLLRTTTCLRSLVYHVTDDDSQPPKSFIDALAANSTLKSVELATQWTTAEPPGPLGEYVRSNSLLTNLMVLGHDVDRKKLLLEEVFVRNDILNGNFHYNDHLTRIIGLSRYISRVSFYLSAGDGTATDFVSLLSKVIGDNYNLLGVDLFNSKVGVEAKRCLFIIRETTRRNSGLVERAADFRPTSHLDWYTATALEKVSRNPALVRELAEKEGVAASQVVSMIRSRLRSVDGLDDFMRLTGVVKECVTCAPPVIGSSMQLQDLGDDCWRLVRRYLSFDDVKRFTITKPDNSASS